MRGRESQVQVLSCWVLQFKSFSGVSRSIRGRIENAQVEVHAWRRKT